MAHKRKGLIRRLIHWLASQKAAMLIADLQRTQGLERERWKRDKKLAIDHITTLYDTRINKLITDYERQLAFQEKESQDVIGKSEEIVSTFQKQSNIERNKARAAYTSFRIAEESFNKYQNNFHFMEGRLERFKQILLNEFVRLESEMRQLLDNAKFDTDKHKQLAGQTAGRIIGVDPVLSVVNSNGRKKISAKKVID